MGWEWGQLRGLPGLKDRSLVPWTGKAARTRTSPHWPRPSLEELQGSARNGAGG